MKHQIFLAMDFGASSGRGMLGRFDGARLELEELHRFSNYYVDTGGTYYWDVFRLFHELLTATEKAGRAAGPGGLTSLGLDTWGTDFGLLDANGQLLGSCRCMRNADGLGVRLAHERMSPQELFRRTGVQTISGNTLFQLCERRYAADVALERAGALLMLPDLLAYFLTGERWNEYTIATTSMLFDPLRRGWDLRLMAAMGLPEHLMGDILYPATARLSVRRELCGPLGLGSLAYIPVATHDTAAAVAAIPLKEGEVFCSSGTWSLFGVEMDLPLLTEEARLAGFSNEGTADGRVRFLKNLMGLWVLQQCMEEWGRAGQGLSWPELVALAEGEAPFRSLVDLERLEFYNAGNMAFKLQRHCADTGQPVPETRGQIARCVYESIALRYRVTRDQLEKLTGKALGCLHIVGGGSQNAMLDQFAANALGCPVYAGPAEAASAGNLLMQVMARGEIAGWTQMRQVVEDSFVRQSYEPRDEAYWDEAYQRFLTLIAE